MPSSLHSSSLVSRMEELERALNLKQLQINRLLNITQAINNNVPAQGLFDMYRSFLSWEMGIRRMALFFRQQNKWHCTSSIGIDEQSIPPDIAKYFPSFKRINNLLPEDEPFFAQFDMVIPVYHKQTPLAFVFIGDLEGEGLFSKVQFITTITNIVAVAIENKRLFKRQLEQERLKQEMRLAAEMQRMLVPSQLPHTPNYQLASIYRPQLGVGGDYFDFIEQNGRHLVFCIGDITGKGMAAALLMASFQGTFHSLVHHYETLDTLVRALNTAVVRTTGGDRFLTLFLAKYDSQTHMLEYINAGHTAPLLAMSGQVVPLDKGCTFLGSFSELPSIEVGRIALSDEALLVSFTDGFSDLRNDKGEFLDDVFRPEFLLAHQQLDAKQFNEVLLNHIEQFAEGKDWPDDFTVLTCKFFPTSRGQGK